MKFKLFTPEEREARNAGRPVIGEAALNQEGFASLQQWSYGRSLSGMTDEALKTEILKQKEIKGEATTGYATDPAAATEAEWRLQAAEAEQARRRLQDPKLTDRQYRKQLARLDEKGLAAEEKRLQAAIEDARGGPHTNEEDAKKLESRLAIVHSAQAQRVVDDPGATPAEYRAATRKLEDKPLLAEQAEVRAEYEATLEQMKDKPALASLYQSKLDRLAIRSSALDAEVARRGLEPAAPKPATKDTVDEPDVVDEPGAQDEVGAEAVSKDGVEAEAVSKDEESGTSGPASTTYTIQPGDTLGDLAWALSQQSGGTRTPAEVLQDILALNDLADPNLIIAGEPLRLPSY